MKELVDNIGDRYIRKMNHGYTVERTDKGNWLCIDDGGGYPYIHGWKVGDEWNFMLLEDKFTYIGNFTKSEKFKQIYDILNS